MQHVPRGQCIGVGGTHFTGRAAHTRAQFRQALALGQQTWAGRAVDGTVHTAPAEQGFVGRVDDRIHRQGRDVALPHFDLHASVSCLLLLRAVPALAAPTVVERASMLRHDRLTRCDYGLHARWGQPPSRRLKW